MKVAIHKVCVNRNHGRKKFGESRWDYEWYSDETWMVRGVRKAKEGDYETWEVPDGTKEVEVVYAFYGDGDTFGRSSGELHIIDVRTDGKGEELVKTVEKHVNSGKFGNLVFLGKEIDTMMLTGYFTHCEGVHCETFTVSV